MPEASQGVWQGSMSYCGAATIRQNLVNGHKLFDKLSRKYPSTADRIGEKRRRFIENNNFQM